MQRLFKYCTPIDYILEAIAITASVASGVALAMVNLVFGLFITSIGEYGSGATTPEQFRKEIAKNRFVLMLE